MANNQSINISSNNVYGACDQKCIFNFNYQLDTSLVAKNNGVMINVSLSEPVSPPVQYNGQKYNPNKLMIVSPSVHEFENSTAVGEILIEHIPSLGGLPLIVCIPFTESSNSTTAGSFLTQIINNVATNAPSDGESININISNFSLEEIIPNKPFYAYKGRDLFKSSANFIVFSQIDAIPITSNILTSLSQIIKPCEIKTPGEHLFYNKNGPNQQVNNEGIYISCKPTGSSGEDVVVSNSSGTTNDTSYNLGQIFNNPTFKKILEILLLIVIIIIFFGILNMIFNYMTGNPIKLPSMSSIKIPGISNISTNTS
jgi:hypothetical protein